MKTILNGILTIIAIIGVTTLVKFTTVKFDEHYVSPIKERTLPRIKNLPAIRINDPSLGQKNPIVRLYSEDGLPLCSGTVISSNYVLTAAHCVLTSTGKLNNENIIVKSSDKLVVIKAKAASAYSRTDIALITGDFSSFKYEKVVTKPVELLNSPPPYISCGFPLGGDLFCTTMDKINFAEFFLISSGILLPGQSGGPFFSSTSGYIMGVNSGVSDSKVIFGPTFELFTVLGVEVIK